MTDEIPTDQTATDQTATDAKADTAESVPDTVTTLKGPEQKPGEIGGPKGPEPTRYGDWEFKGRCSDF